MPNDDINPDDFHGPHSEGPHSDGPHSDAVAAALAREGVVLTSPTGEIQPSARARGLTVSIYRGAYRSNLNVFNGYEKVTLIGRYRGERIAPVSPWTEDAPPVILGETVPGHTVAWPADKGHRWTMFGGSFIWTGDSRMPGGRPIPLHDRFEGDGWHWMAARRS